MLPIVIFDIGNVLVRYAPGPALEALCRRVGCSRWKARWAFGRAGVHLLAKGLVPPKTFLDDVNRRLGADLSHEELRDLWGLDLPEGVDGMIELLEQTRERAVVALLSDTNAFHWDFLALRFPALAAVPHRFLSFVEGMAKPDPEFYRHVEAQLRERMKNSTTDDAGPRSNNPGGVLTADNTDDTDGRKATARRARREAGLSILYFDDLAVNIKAARSRGWDAVRFTRRRDAEDTLRRRGILP